MTNTPPGLNTHPTLHDCWGLKSLTGTLVLNRSKQHSTEQSRVMTCQRSHPFPVCFIRRVCVWFGLRVFVGSYTLGHWDSDEEECFQDSTYVYLAHLKPTSIHILILRQKIETLFQQERSSSSSFSFALFVIFSAIPAALLDLSRAARPLKYSTVYLQCVQSPGAQWHHPDHQCSLALSLPL